MMAKPIVLVVSISFKSGRENYERYRGYLGYKYCLQYYLHKYR